MAFNSSEHSKYMACASVSPTRFSRKSKSAVAKPATDDLLDDTRERVRELGHDLRTPLNAIIGFSEMLLDGAVGEIENERHREYLEYVQRSGLEMLETVRNLLEENDIGDDAAIGDAPPRCV
jgi:signal transduction histidine kinase